VPSTHARKLPVPESLRLVTSMITPPRPPTAPAPPPSALGNAAIAPGFTLTALTFTCADADLLASASLVAVTVSVPALAGAVYRPVDVIWPSAAVQATDLSVAVPCTVAENCRVPPVNDVALVGDIVTDDTVGDGGCGFVGDAVTVTTAAPVLVPSATLVAVTVSVPAFAGAV